MLDRRAIERRIVELRAARAAIDETIELLQREVLVRAQYKIATNGKMYTGAKAEDLKPYIQEWLDQGYTLQTLADKALVSEYTLQKIMRGAIETVQSQKADAIITALGITHKYDELVPEPPPSIYYED